MTARTVSRHMLRRTARAREHRLRVDQVIIRTYQLGTYVRLSERMHSEARLSNAGVGVDDRLAVVRSHRGPFGWRVVAVNGR